MRKILFVISSNQHMGDLAFCYEWIGELGYRNFRFAFLIDRSIKKYIYQSEQIFYYDPVNDIRDEVLKAIHTFLPDLVIYASGNGWNLKGQKGGNSHEMLTNEIINTNVPLLAFDTKEGYQEPFLEEYKEHPIFTNNKIPSPEISKHFIGLRNSPNYNENFRVKYYKIKNRFIKLECDEKDKILYNFGINKSIKTVLFSISKGTYNISSNIFYDYYEHIAHLFQSCESLPLKFIIVAPEKIKSLDSCKNVIQVCHLPYKEYLSLLKACDLLLSDTIWSTSILLATCVGIPSALLCNLRPLIKKPVKKSKSLKWSDLQQELILNHKQSLDIKYLINQHKDILNKLYNSPAMDKNISPFEYINDYILSNPESSKDELWIKLIDFLSVNKEIEKKEYYLTLCNKHESLSINKISELLDIDQRVILQKLKLQSLLDIDTGYDPIGKSLHEISKLCAKKKIYFKKENSYPYKVFPYGLVKISNYLIDQYHIKDCFVELDVFNTEKFPKSIKDLVFDENIYQPILDQCKEFQSKYDKIPLPVEIVEKLLSIHSMPEIIYPLNIIRSKSKKSYKLEKWDWNNKIDIVIPFYNQPKLLSRCLKSIELSGYCDGQIIIVNDNSNPKDFKVIEDLCSNLVLEIKLISHKTNKGFRDSILTGIKECKSKYLFLINSDTVVTYNFAHKLTGVMVNDERFKAVAPISNHPTDLYQFRKKIYLKQQFDNKDHNAIIDKFEPILGNKWLYEIKRKWFSGNITIAPYLSASCLAIDRSVFEKVGFLDGQYYHGYFEDLDLCCRIRNLGYQLAINEDCFVFHRGQGSYKEKAREWKKKLVWKNYYIFKDRWGHLPEHKDLEKRMRWAGRECPL